MKKLLSLLCAVVLLSGCSTTSSWFGGSDCQSKLERDFQENATNTVYFAFDSSQLSADAVAALDTQVAWLKDNRNVNVVIQGYCDKRGTAEYNMALGERRAEAVKQYLISQGICAKRITTVSYGKEYAFPGDTEEAYAKSRRGVTVVELSR
ncbi:MAG: OmpA family protein [Alphaproteobacteria bacterium]|nr:OmpA family protein [Alphaproteobacteria bacterium]